MKENEIMAAKWKQGDFGEGFANYVQDSVTGRWFSVNGWQGEICEIRWEVRKSSVIVLLEN